MLEDATVEALMVLLGTDAQRILIAVGLDAATADIGSLCVLAETAAHDDRMTLDVAALVELGAAGWREALARLRATCPELLAAPVADPRTALPELAVRIAAALPAPVAATTAGLLGACLIQRGQLAEYLGWPDER
jgi:hypothetical protein